MSENGEAWGASTTDRPAHTGTVVGPPTGSIVWATSGVPLGERTVISAPAHLGHFSTDAPLPDDAEPATPSEQGTLLEQGTPFGAGEDDPWAAPTAASVEPTRRRARGGALRARSGAAAARAAGKTSSAATTSGARAAGTAAAGAGAAVAKQVFRPVQLSRPQALGAAVVAAGAASAAAMAFKPTASGTGLSSAVPGDTPPASVVTGPGGTPGLTRGPDGTIQARLLLPATIDVEHLLRRVTYGPTAELRADVERAGGPNGWLAQQFAPEKITDPLGDKVVGMFPRLRMSSGDADRQIGDGDEWEFQRDLASLHLARAIWSKRQLFEVMVDFWSNHFNIACPGDKGGKFRHRFDLDVIRKGALGRFEDLLQVTSVHPAMLLYLDNALSTGQNPNENYARELLELHTVGVDGGYTERDVKQAALLLTGFEVKHGSSQFTPSRHYVGPVKVMGFSHRNGTRSGGRQAAADLLSYLAKHPATAKFLAHKLAVRFVSDDPSPELVARLAKTYLEADTAIVPVLVDLLNSEEFAKAEGAKVRRPMERLVATARVLGVRPTTKGGLTKLYWMLEEAGQRPLAWPLPNGYADVASAWQSPGTALSLFNSSAQLAHGWWPDEVAFTGLEKLVKGSPRTRSTAIAAVSQVLLGRAPTAAEKSAATKLLSSTKLPAAFGTGTWEQKETLGLTATLLLNSPAHLVR